MSAFSTPSSKDLQLIGQITLGDSVRAIYAGENIGDRFYPENGSARFIVLEENTGGMIYREFYRMTVRPGAVLLPLGYECTVFHGDDNRFIKTSDLLILSVNGEEVSGYHYITGLLEDQQAARAVYESSRYNYSKKGSLSYINEIYAGKIDALVAVPAVRSHFGIREADIAAGPAVTV